MIAYVTVGADDIALAKQFYAAFLPALGYELTEGVEGLSFALPVTAGQSPALPDFYVKPTFNGRPASAGNGSMVAFEARNQQQVRDVHAAALAAGGSDAGAPGFRASYGRISMSATCATRKAIKSPCLQVIRQSPGATAKAGGTEDCYIYGFSTRKT